MASKAFSLYSLIFIHLIFKSVAAESKSSGFDFLKNLQGYKKGEKVQGSQDLKKYLHRFGYLNYQNPSIANTDDFDDELESAIKRYQLNFHLKPTGILDPNTVSQMMKPRCGVADNINGRTSKKFHNNNSASKLHVVSRYAFEEGKWPPQKYHLTYGFELNTIPAAVAPVKRAFGTWEANSQFTFEITEFFYDADLRINFYRGDHGDGYPFDGPNGTLAHSFPTTNGGLHFDADENWAVGAVSGAFDLETVALHEIGHLLGLDHSTVEDAIMFPIIPIGQVKGLDADDIQGIRELYNL